MKKAKSYQAKDLESLIDLIAKLHDDLQENMGMLEDIICETSGVDLQRLKIAHKYLQGAKVGIDHAHFDLTDCNFKMFSNEYFNWSVK